MNDNTVKVAFIAMVGVITVSYLRVINKFIQK